MVHRLFLLTLVVCTATSAQRFDIAVLGGGQVSFEPNTNVGAGVALGGNLGVRLVNAPFADLFVEFPLTGAFKINSELPSQVAQRDYSTLFFAPGLRLKLAPVAPVSPFFAIGYGTARFRQEASPGAPERTTRTNVVQFGFGTDFKVAPFFSLRTEFRDYYSGPLRFDSTLSERQHNLTGMLGLVFRF